MFSQIVTSLQKILINYFNIEILKVRPRNSIRFSKKYFKDRQIIAVEIGAYEGDHALQILKNLNIKKLYLIDPWKEYEDYLKSEPDKNQKKLNKSLEICKRRLFKYRNKVVFIRDLSENAVNKVPKADYIYIDGNHEYEYVKKDLKNYWPKLKKGGIFAGHDIQCFDVSRALIEFCCKKKLVPYISERRDWWIIKK